MCHSSQVWVFIVNRIEMQKVRLHVVRMGAQCSQVPYNHIISVFCVFAFFLHHLTLLHWQRNLARTSENLDAPNPPRHGRIENRNRESRIAKGRAFSCSASQILNRPSVATLCRNWNACTYNGPDLLFSCIRLKQVRLNFLILYIYIYFC